MTTELPVEVDVEFAARYLGTTERTIINYLKARQIDGEKVGKKWFIKSASLARLRPEGSALKDAVLPAPENPKSVNQHEREARRDKHPKDWSLTKSRRNPMNLGSFVHLKDAADLIDRDRESFSETDGGFLKAALVEIGDDLGAGYYSFGPLKRKLYGRARLRAGRLVSRAILMQAPQGLMMLLCQLADAVAYLCRSIDKRMTAATPSTKDSKGEKDVQV